MNIVCIRCNGPNCAELTTLDNRREQRILVSASTYYHVRGRKRGPYARGIRLRRSLARAYFVTAIGNGQ